jgi:hypothetical protein
MCHLSISPLWSVWSLSHLIIHSPPAICPAPFHVSLPSRRAHYISSPAPTTYCLPPCVFPCRLSHTSLLLIPPPRFWRHHSPSAPNPSCWPPRYSSGRSVNPGGSTRGLPRHKGAELAGLSSIPIKQLLKQLVVVRHRLRHNGKVRRRIKGTSIRPRNCQEFDCVRRRCTIIQRLQVQIVRSHADAKF